MTESIEFVDGLWSSSFNLVSFSIWYLFPLKEEKKKKEARFPTGGFYKITNCFYCLFGEHLISIKVKFSMSGYFYDAELLLIIISCNFSLSSIKLLYWPANNYC